MDKFKDIFKSLTIYKAFAAYNMVIIHAAAILYPYLVEIGYNSSHIGITWIRALFSMTFPIIAGFYFRHFIGPYMGSRENLKKMSTPIVSIVMWSFVLESIRIYLIKFDINLTVTWHVLHFLSLSSVIALVVIYFSNSKYLYLLGAIIVVVMSFFFSYDLKPLLIGPLSKVQSFSFSIIHSFFIGAMIIFLLHKVIKNRWFLSFTATLSILSSFYFIQDDSSALKGIADLALAIWLPIEGSRHHWPFFQFFPIFIFGYFTRELVFSIDFERREKLYFSIILLISLMIFYYGLWLPHVEAERLAVITRGVISIPAWILLILCGVFYISWSFIYWSIKKKENWLIDFIVKYFGSVLVLYVIHTAFFSLLAFLFKYKNWHKSLGLLGVYILIHLIYFLSVFISYVLTRLWDRYNRNMVTTRPSKTEV